LYIKYFDKNLDKKVIYSDELLKNIFIKKDGHLSFARCAEPFLKNRPNLKKYIINRYPKDEFYNIGTNIKRICYNIEHLKKCKNPNCNNKIKDLIHDYCCDSCAASDEKVINSKYISSHKNNPEDPYNSKQAYITAHKNNPQDPYNRDKKKETCAKNHPDDPTCGQFGSKRHEEAMIEKYGDKNYSNREKAKQTREEKLKKDPHYYDESNDNRKNTLNNKLIENPNYWEERWIKIKNSKLINHPEEPNRGEFGSFTNKKVMLNLYGEEFFIKTPEFKIKTRTKLLEKYKVDNIAKFKPIAMIRGEHSRITKVERGIILDYTKIDIDDYKNYCILARNLSNKIYNEFIYYINPENIKRGSGEDEFHLDHIYSISKGWENKIPIFIITCPVNLRMINSRENIKKSKRCDISISELYIKAMDFIKEHPEFLNFIEDKYKENEFSNENNQIYNKFDFSTKKDQEYQEVLWEEFY